MTSTQTNRRNRTAGQIALVMARVFLGASFCYLGLVKASDPVAFLKQVRAYELISQPILLNSVAVILPWLEMLCGLLLILGVALRGTALVTLTLLVFFTGAVANRGVALAREQDERLCLIKFDCGCGTGEVFVCNKLAENSLLIGLAALPLIWPAQRFSLGRDSRAAGPASPPPDQAPLR
jgi:uncharacterized membrane protein YphA (DoxX/SURF4 family)